MASTIVRRKRPLGEVVGSASASASTGDNKKRPYLGNQKSSLPLAGVVACLSGLPHDKKEVLHQTIERLGGRYTRDFNLDQNTHLVSASAKGAKYELALSYPQIKIVATSWLEVCEKTEMRVDEATYIIQPVTAKPKESSIISDLDRILQCGGATGCSLFDHCCFLLLGFEQDMQLRVKLGKLIRRAKGTIFWEMNKSVTHLIVHDLCDEPLRKAARIVTEHHLNAPPAASPQWVLESWKRKAVQPPSKFPPIKGTPILQTTKTPVESKPQQLRSKATSSSTIFRGHLFALVRIAPPSWAVDFDSKKQEQTIKAHAGQMVSLKLIAMMRMDAVKSDDTGGKRKCFVVCWGGFSQTHMELNPILSQLKRYNLCDMEFVSPIWLQTCISVQKRVHSNRIRCAFEPQTWPFRRLELPDKMKQIQISLTGFQGSEKAAIIHLTNACGATFLDSMSNAATHLICKRSGGAKYEMAIKWGIHAVSVEWLYHVVQYGYGGKDESKIGCELAFAFESL